jgi:hypothetical protein
MNTLSRFSTVLSAAGVIPWLLNLATRLLARGLNMPEPLVHTTGVIVLAQVQSFENTVGKTLCPIRLLHRLHRLAAPAGALIASPFNPAKGELP